MKTNSHFRFVLLLMLAASIFVRGLVPAGFMADMSSKKMALTICSGMTTKTIFVEDKTAPSGHHSEQKYDPCPFAPPTLANNAHSFDVADYVRIAYAPFLPDPTAHLALALVPVKTFQSQGPPENFV